MLYTVNLDQDNYILSVAHTANDNVNLDLDSMELDFLNAYQLINGQCILDQEKKEEIIAEREAQALTPTQDELYEAQMLLNAAYAGAPVVLYGEEEEPEPEPEPTPEPELNLEITEEEEGE